MPVNQVDRDSIGGLGMRQEDVDSVEAALRKGRGIIFVCGPPGSGRRSAMYSLLCSVNDESQSVLAADDTAQPHLVGVGQTVLEPRDRVGDWMQLAMRVDADVLMVKAIEHVMDAVSVVRASSRIVVVAGSESESSLGPLRDLEDLGASAKVICRAVTCIVATRVLPRLCTHCRRQIPMPSEPLAPFPPVQQAAMTMRAFEGPGCERCEHTGRRGLVGLYEVREIGPQLEAILEGGYSAQSLADASMCTTAMALLGDALQKSHAGLIDLRDLMPLIDRCPTNAGDFANFWEN